MSLVYEKAFTAPGCGQALFASVAAYRENADSIRKQQVAIVAARHAWAMGGDRDDAALLLAEALLAAGMDEETVREHCADFDQDVSGLFASASDL